ncbi:MAG: xanthine dehydrogenase [Polyangiaceae bacterium]|nr:xanthine dehydrogenase [Polyangiaceae bacterium]
MTIADLSSMLFDRVRDLSALCTRVGELSDEGIPFVLLAGGTDWMVEQEMREPLASDVFPTVIDVSQMGELRGIRLDGDILRIGAATRYLEMRRHPAVLERAPLLERMARDVGAIQIQARGTLGGNIATGSPAADGVAALAAFDALVVVKSRRGERHIPLSELQTGYKTSTRAPDEIIVAIEIYLPSRNATWFWRKVGTRKAQAISKVALAAIAEVQGGQVVRCGLGMASVAPVTALLPRTRELFLSTRLDAIDDFMIDKCVESDIQPITDVRSTGPYRLHVAKAVVREFARSLGAA